MEVISRRHSTDVNGDGVFSFDLVTDIINKEEFAAKFRIDRQAFRKLLDSVKENLFQTLELDRRTHKPAVLSDTRLGRKLYKA